MHFDTATIITIITLVLSLTTLVLLILSKKGKERYIASGLEPTPDLADIEFIMLLEHSPLSLSELSSVANVFRRNPRNNYPSELYPTLMNIFRTLRPSEGNIDYTPIVDIFRLRNRDGSLLLSPEIKNNILQAIARVENDYFERLAQRDRNRQRNIQVENSIMEEID